MKTKITFEEYLKKENLAENSIESYLWTVDYFVAHYEQVSSENLLAYKGFLMEYFKPKTVNLRIQAMNKYLDYLEKPQLRLKAVKIQQKSFLENVISNADYKFLKRQLKKDGNTEWYFVVWYLAATGARVSELIRIKIEHVELGYFDLYTVSAKYSCGFPDPQVLPIIVVDRYLDYFTTIMEDRLWQVLAEPVSRWRNRSGLSMNAARAA